MHYDVCVFLGILECSLARMTIGTNLLLTQLSYHHCITHVSNLYACRDILKWEETGPASSTQIWLGVTMVMLFCTSLAKVP